MIYIFDSSSLIDLFRHYYLDRFPTLWSRFDELINQERIISVREVFNEIKSGGDRLSTWANENESFFKHPSEEELNFVKEIFLKKEFQLLIKSKERLQGKPVADPFVISTAKLINGCAVTEESVRSTGTRIPNICQHFNIQCVNLEQFMKTENWIF